MKKHVSIIVFALVAIICASLFAAEAKKSLGFLPVQDLVKTADSERAVRRLDDQISAALIKVKKFSVRKLQAGEDTSSLDYLLEMNMIEYSETTETIKKMKQKTSKYNVEIKLTNLKKNEILVQDSIEGSFVSDKIAMEMPDPEVYTSAMAELVTKIADMITSTLFNVSVVDVSEGGILTILNYGFKVGDVLNVYKLVPITDADGNELANKEDFVCPIIVMEVSGDTARAMIHTLKPYKGKYAKATIENGMICKRATDAPIDEKTLAPLMKKFKKAK